MRVYVPATLPALAQLLATGSLAPPVPAYAVTELLRTWADASGPSDEEELELVALSEAARGSLRLLAADPAGTQRRLVLAADAPDQAVRVDEASDASSPGQVVVTAAVPVAWVRAVHLDEVGAEAAVRVAATAVGEADADDPAAEAVVARLDDHELLWYAVEELPGLLSG